MKRAQRRREWLINRRYALRQGKPVPVFQRLPGSLNPFRRIAALTDAVVKAQAALVEAHAAAKKAADIGILRMAVALVAPKKEAKRVEEAQAKTTAALAAQDAYVKASRNLSAYPRERHYSPKFGEARSKYQPHQGARECARRLEQCRFTAINGWRWSFARDLAWASKRSPFQYS